MCLFKVYLKDENSKRKLIAEDIALSSKENNRIKIRNSNLEEETWDNVEIIMIDALNSILLIKKLDERAT